MGERHEISIWVCKVLPFRKWNEKLVRSLGQIAPLGFAPGKSLDACPFLMSLLESAVEMTLVLNINILFLLLFSS